jgi:hypothetical protein
MSHSVISFFKFLNVAPKIGKYLMKYCFLFLFFPFHTKNIASSIAPC